MHVHVGLFTICQKSTEIFERSSITVNLHIFNWNQKISQMEIFFHEKSYVYCRNCEEKTSLIMLHLYHQIFVSLHKPKNQLQRKNSSSSEIRLRILALKTQSDPLFSRHLRRLREVLSIQRFDEIPSLIFLKGNIGLFFESVKKLQLFFRDGVVIAEHTLAPVFALEMSFRLRWQEGSLSLHLIIIYFYFLSLELDRRNQRQINY